ncbi:MAG: GNAT family N-acetyltransferase [Alphaproteobacteria bacterium]|nr:GNAT family N-acetyltransferase [Alphaproteobacteria bacterium]
MAHQTESWRRQVVYSGRTHAVIVAETKGYGLTGLASLGPARDRGLERYTGEVYALYVDPNYMGNGIGSALLRAAFRLLAERGFGGAVIWALQGNNARYFYEAQGGKEIAMRQGRLWGSRIQEVAFGWDSLAATLGGTPAKRG